MSSISELPPVHITNKQQLGRKLVTALMALPLPAEALVQESSLNKIAELTAQKSGLVLAFTHSCMGDHPRFLRKFMSHRLFTSRGILVPLGLHEYNPATRILGEVTGITIMPVVTQGTLEALHLPESELGKGMSEYLDASTQYLKKGGITVIAPQGGRRSRLGEPEGKPMWSLLRAARDAEATNIAILPIGLGSLGRQNYEDRGGRFGELFQVKFGSPLTYTEIMAQVPGQSVREKFRNVDGFIFEKLRELVPPGYR